MQLSAKTSDYLTEVTRHIRWKRARAPIAQELRCHIEDQTEALLCEKLPAEEAEARAIAEMGDADEIGSSLDRAYRPRRQPVALLCAVALFCIGFFGRGLALEQTAQLGFSGAAPHSWAMMLGLYRVAPFSWVMMLLLCIGVFLFFYLVDYTLLRRAAWLLYGGYLAAFVLVLLFGQQVNGRVSLGIYFAPMFPILFSGLLARFRGRGLVGVLLCGCTVLPVLALELQVPHFAGVLLCGLGCLLLLTDAICRGWFGCRGQQKCAALLLCWVPALLVVVLFLWCLAGSFLSLSARFQMLLHPEVDPYGRGWLVLAVRKALDSAQFFGGAATDAALMPLMTSDYLLTFLICRFGWVALLVVVGLLAFLLVVGLRTALRQKNALGRMVSLSVVLILGFESTFFLLANLGSPFFFSSLFPFFGGICSLMLHSALFGLMMSVLRSGDLFFDLPDALPTSPPRPIFEKTEDGALIIRFRG